MALKSSGHDHRFFASISQAKLNRARDAPSPRWELEGQAGSAIPFLHSLPQTRSTRTVARTARDYRAHPPHQGQGRSCFPGRGCWVNQKSPSEFEPNSSFLSFFFFPQYLSRAELLEVLRMAARRAVLCLLLHCTSHLPIFSMKKEICGVFYF